MKRIETCVTNIWKIKQCMRDIEDKISYSETLKFFSYFTFQMDKNKNELRKNLLASVITPM